MLYQTPPQGGLVISAERLKLITTIGNYLLFPILGYFFKTVSRSLKESLNEIITDNVNRIKEELREHFDTSMIQAMNSVNNFVDSKTVELENAALGHLKMLDEAHDSLRRKLVDMDKQLQNIHATLNKKPEGH